jgi:DNA modification methylase
MSVEIKVGDCRDVLKTMADQSVHCVVTSPPYFGLRDYGVGGQMGLETTPEAFVTALVAVLREARRVLRDDGTLWLNLGDSYANDGKWGGHTGGKHAKVLHASPIGRNKRYTGLKPKDLIGIPWRVAFALQADGWFLRQDIIWAKPNPMPESVRDRCTKSHEYLFLLSKAKRYYFDADAILEPISAATVARLSQPNLAGQAGSARVPGKTNGNMKAVARGKGNAKTFRGGGKYTQGRSFDNSAVVDRESHGNVPNESGLRNKRSVWTVTTKPFKGAHFATFPPDLIEPCVLAGCPVGGVVLDPFGGAGTTGMVANRNCRNAVLIELNPEYAALARTRIDTPAKPQRTPRPPANDNEPDLVDWIKAHAGAA